MKSLLKGLTMVWLGMSALTGVANSTVLYREIFPRPPAGVSQEAQVGLNGWYGGNTGDSFMVNSSGEGAFSGGTGATEETPINSNPLGGLNPSGFGFWSKAGVSNNFFYSTEYTLPSNALLSVMWNSRNQSNSTNTLPGPGQGREDEVNTHLAFRIGDFWYVSDQGFLQQGNDTAWRSNMVNISDLTWGLFNNWNGPDNPNIIPGRSSTMGSGIASLPAGTINAFGLWWERVSGPSSSVNGTNRIDNFTLIGDAAIPEIDAMAGTGALAFLSGILLLLSDRRRRDSH